MGFPPDRPKVPKRPWPPGTVVTGYAPNGAFGFPQHHLHIFMVGDAARSEHSNVGWRQAVHCILCDMWMEVDAEFLLFKATTQEINQCIRYITRTRNRLLRARHQLREVRNVERRRGTR